MWPLPQFLPRLLGRGAVMKCRLHRRRPSRCASSRDVRRSARRNYADSGTKWSIDFAKSSADRLRAACAEVFELATYDWRVRAGREVS